jgi:hypothetical protein
MAMGDWFAALAAGDALPARAASDLQERGFTVVPGPTPAAFMAPLVAAYDAAVASATGEDVRHGTTTTRVADFVNRGPAFDSLYLFPPLLQACHRVIGRPFKLSSLQARTLRPGAPHQGLHVDVPRHVVRVARCRAHSFHARGAPGPRSRPECGPRRARA